MANKRKAGKRVNGRLSQARADKLARREAPSERILARRELFSFVTPSKGPDGRVGEIDQDICDGIGQLHALGLLDGHGIDALELRNRGREYAELYWRRYNLTAPKTGAYERAPRSSSSYDGETAADRLFDRMDGALTGFDRQCLMSLIVDHSWGDEIVGWAHSVICHALIARKRVPASALTGQVIRLPVAEDWAMLNAAIRGLCVIVDCSLPMRWAA